jgi:hypothetical protein
VSWFSVDDGFADHPKVVRLQAMEGWQSAIALWSLAGSWCSKHLTDGAVPPAMVTRLGATAREADMLVEAGLWERSAEGFQFHDWLGCNPSRADVLERRRKTNERVSKHRGNASRNAVQTPLATPLPSSPLPSPPKIPPTPQRDGANGAGEKPSPSRLIPLVQTITGAVALEREISPAPEPFPSQVQTAARRVQELLDRKVFPDAESAVRALVEAAFDAVKGTRRSYGLALTDATVAPPKPEFRDNVLPWGRV